MNRICTASIACLALLAGCSKNNKETENPDAGSYDGFTDETPDGEGDSDTVASAGGDTTTTEPTGPRPKARASSGTRGKTTLTGKHRSLVAKKPPVTTPTKPNRKPKGDFKPADPAVVAGAVPNLLVAGGMFDVFGEAFDEDPAKNKVYIGRTAQKVIEVAGDHLIVQAVGPTSGKLRVVKGAVGRKARRGADGSRTANAYTVIDAGEGFAAPAKTAGHGLLGTLYNVGQASTEMPDFNSVGDPVGYVLMDNLDIGTGDFAGFPAGDAKLHDNFGIHFQGSLNVLESGDYEICLAAGDGAILFLNGEPMIDNDGAGETREVCDSLEIEPGEYDLQLLYYQNDGDTALRLTWAKDGGSKEAIPATAFFPPENMDGLAAALNQ